MATASDNPDRRGSARELRRVACEVEVDGRRYTAVVLDLSVRGMFLRCSAAPEAGAPVLVRMRRPGGQTWELDARVVRSRDRAGSPSARGFAVEVDDAPEAYSAFVDELAANGR